MSLKKFELREEKIGNDILETYAKCLDNTNHKKGNGSNFERVVFKLKGGFRLVEKNNKYFFQLNNNGASGGLDVECPSVIIDNEGFLQKNGLIFLKLKSNDYYMLDLINENFCFFEKYDLVFDDVKFLKISEGKNEAIFDLVNRNMIDDVVSVSNIDEDTAEVVLRDCDNGYCKTKYILDKSGKLKIDNSFKIEMNGEAKTQQHKEKVDMIEKKLPRKQNFEIERRDAISERKIIEKALEDIKDSKTIKDIEKFYKNFQSSVENADLGFFYNDNYTPYNNFGYSVIKDGQVLKNGIMDFGKFSNGLLRVVNKDGTIDFIDGNANEIIKLPKFEGFSLIADDFSKCGLACVGIKDNSSGEVNYGYIDSTGDFVILPQFRLAKSFDNNGLANVFVSNGKKDYACIINKNGEFVIKPEYRFLKNCENGKYITSDENENCGIIDKNGKVILPLSDKFRGLCYVGDNLYAFNTYFQKDHRECGYGCINEKGEIVIPPKYEYSELQNAINNFLKGQSQPQ